MLSIHSANRVINFFWIKVCWSAIPSERILRPCFRMHQLNRLLSKQIFHVLTSVLTNQQTKYLKRTLRFETAQMNSLPQWLCCGQFASGPFSGASLSEWRPNFLTSELFVALISVIIVNLLVTPLRIFLNVLVILSVKATPQLRHKYNVLLACLAGTDVMTGALGQPFLIAELIYRLTGSPASEFCIISHTAGSLSRASALISLQHLALISIERYISIKFPFKYGYIVTKCRLFVSVVLVWSLAFLTLLLFRYKIFFLG